MSEPKYRNEYKYVIDSGQLALLLERARAVMRSDSHTEGTRSYNVRSVYFDDEGDTCYLENENGTDPREKYRIRIYNHSDRLITLERKAKRSQKCLKQGCPLTRLQCESLLRGEPPVETGCEPLLLRRFTALMRTRLLRSVVIVEYDRIPFVHPLGNVRVTLDCNLRASASCHGFFDARLPLRPVLPIGAHIAEVKWDEFLPDYIYQALMLESLQWQSFSKFYLCRRHTR